MIRFLCISDIHGHADALRKVLAEGKSRGYDQLVACGDHLFPGPAPLETWKILVAEKAICVQGLTDAAVAQIDPTELNPETDDQQARVDALSQLHDELGELIVRRLAQLKTQARLPLESGHEIVFVHGSPVDPTETMAVEMDDDELCSLIGADPADMIVCGSSHVPFERKIGEVSIVGVGSVGEAPTPGIAYATILESTSLGVRVEQFEVEL
ncbi:MAG: hypothetical protein RJA70_1771 [Pseudomonadota bacterium]|jgi:predicted phosphodiesterase